MRGVAPVNLNKQAEDATIALIAEVKARGIDLAEVSSPVPPFSIRCEADSWSVLL